MTTTDQPTAAGYTFTPADLDNLAAGLQWLYHTGQPDGAILSHHGINSPSTGQRWMSFVPDGGSHNGNCPVLVIQVAHPQLEGGMFHNPIGADTEMRAWKALIECLGFRVDHHWNWNGHGDSGGFALGGAAHPTLRAAVKRYSRGCLQHPGGGVKTGVFCDCGWYQAGETQVVKPAWHNNPAGHTQDTDPATLRARLDAVAALLPAAILLDPRDVQAAIGAADPCTCLEYPYDWDPDCPPHGQKDITDAEMAELLPRVRQVRGWARGGWHHLYGDDPAATDCDDTYAAVIQALVGALRNDKRLDHLENL